MEVASFPFQRGGMEGWLQWRLSTVAPATRAQGQTPQWQFRAGKAVFLQTGQKLHVLLWLSLGNPMRIPAVLSDWLEWGQAHLDSRRWTLFFKIQMLPRHLVQNRIQRPWGKENALEHGGEPSELLVSGVEPDKKEPEWLLCKTLIKNRRETAPMALSKLDKQTWGWETGHEPYYYQEILTWQGRRLWNWTNHSSLYGFGL